MINKIDIDCENKAWGPVVELYKKYTSMPLSAAVWSTGAFPNTKTADLEKYINLPDWINIMAYDAGSDFKALDAYRAYKKVFKKQIYVGFCIGEQSWGGHVTTIDEVVQVKSGLDPGDSFFIWALGKRGTPTVSEILGVAANPTVPKKASQVSCPYCKVLLTIT